MSGVHCIIIIVIMVSFDVTSHDTGNYFGPSKSGAFAMTVAPGTTRRWIGKIKKHKKPLFRNRRPGRARVPRTRALRALFFFENASYVTPSVTRISAAQSNLRDNYGYNVRLYNNYCGFIYFPCFVFCVFLHNTRLLLSLFLLLTCTVL